VYIYIYIYIYVCVCVCVCVCVYDNKKNNSQIVPTCAACGDIPMYPILPR